MNKKRLTKTELEALRAKIQGGYRQSISESLDEIEREELLARLDETQLRLEKLQARLDGMGDPAWKVALRIAGVAVVWLGMGALGWWKFGGIWGAIGALLSPFVLLIGGACLYHYGDIIVRGRRHPIGVLAVDIMPAARRVTFAWTGSDASLPLGLLAQFDRKVWEWSVSKRSKEPGIMISTIACEAAEAHLRGEPTRAGNWTAAPGSCRNESVSLTRDRLGIEYSTHHSMGGPVQDFGQERAATLALIDYGLKQAAGDAFARAVIEIAKRYNRGSAHGRKVIRKLGSTFV